uniref:Uncharacterized protein n=1 Tax=Trypanosoma vivax (strain Y486) TaxID=1055687 RepID=G0U3Y1_TRYVY|nr:conserved hypothetical protein [Trypanosoma vivax Y486]
MRDALTSFIEASAAQGSWESALVAWQTVAASGTAPSTAQTALLTRVLAQSGRWREAISVSAADAGKSMCPLRISARCVAMLAAVGANRWVEACQQLYNVWYSATAHAKAERNPVADGTSGSVDRVRKELHRMATLFVNQVTPIMPKEQQSEWLQIVRHTWCGTEALGVESSAMTSLEVDEKRGADGSNDWTLRDVSPQLSDAVSTTVTNNDELLHILHKPKERHSWCSALDVLAAMPHPNASSVNITVRILTNQGRHREVVDVVSRFMIPRGIQPTTVTAKVLAESANTMRSGSLCSLILKTPSLRQLLTPQSAVPLVLALQRLGKWQQCLEWWRSLPPASVTVATPKELHNLRNTGEANLKHHLKLSSYVAVCIASGGGSWLDALGALHSAAAYDPPLTLLFALRALRVAGRWEAAVTLLMESRAVWEKSPLALQVLEVVVKQNAESWIPHNVVRALQQKFGT